MGNVNIKINGIKYSGDNSETVLDICRKNDIEIPTLCYHEQLKPYGSCFLCTVEIKGARKKYSLSCSTKIVDGMEIQTDTKDLWIQRKMALELLLSNHYADCIGPCKSTCPSNVDVQGYIAAIAEGNYKEAIKIIKEDNPFPSVCGRVCTRPCEDECRRNLVDERVGIDYMKRYAADRDIADGNSYIPPKKPLTGKKIAIIGAGPSGLSCAYYLAKEGHNVDIFEQYEKAGGMVRYGIPEYRQPNDVLDVEIKSITDLGPKIYTNRKLGKDFTIDDLKNKGYDAIYIAIGAHNSMKMGIEGEDSDGVFGGIDLLRDVARGEKPSLGDDVIIIGGGNTAVDTARTSLRLGVRNVTMIYRRTINEMPAHQSEIEDAQEEGVKISFLTNPIRLIKDKSNHVIQIECIKMELGEADSSGRRRPIPIDGSEFRIKTSSVVFSIGQRSDISFIESENTKIIDALKFTRKNTIETGKNTFMTDIQGVFAGGDFRRGPDTVIGAIADGKKSAWVINKYLTNAEIIPYPEEFFSKKDDLSKQIRDNYQHLEKIPKMIMPKLTAKTRINNFNEVELGLSEDMTHNESLRCLECGCNSVFDCELKDNSTDYSVDQSYYSGEFKDIAIDDRHPYIIFEPNKCISCARCIRMCKEVVGLSILGFVNRGFDTVVQPSIGKSLLDTDCISCGLCADACPTGAIAIKPNTLKPGPFKLETKRVICPFCSFGCELDAKIMGNKIISINGFHNSDVNLYGNICKMGRFAFREFNTEDNDTIDYNAMKDNIHKLKEFLLASKSEEIAFFIGGSASLEEMYVWKKISEHFKGSQIGTVKNINLVDGLECSFGTPLSPNNYKTIRNADLILLINISPYDEAPMVMPEIMRRKAEGAEIVYIGKEDIRIKRIANIYLDFNGLKEISDFINKISASLIANNKINSAFIKQRTNNFKDFIKYIDENYKDIPDIAKRIGELYISIDNSVVITSFISNQSLIISSISNILLLSGKIGRNNSGLIVFGESSNSEGANILGLTNIIKQENIQKAVFYGEKANNNALGIIKSNYYLFNYANSNSDNFIRINNPFANEGLYVNAERRVKYSNSIVRDLHYSNLDILIELLNGISCNEYTVKSMKDEMELAYPYLFYIKYNDTLPDNLYKYFFTSSTGKGNFIVSKEYIEKKPIRGEFLNDIHVI